ncbi:MAG: PLDc_N domain-containing protein [Candidatus Omnitrophica bacterium]|nr:PLDc_N domain-containing protein [Candidatus Omnitrophota bacterium]
MGPLIGLVVLVLDILAIIDVLKSNQEQGKKILWVLLIFFLPLIGLILYYLVGKK